MARTGGSSHLLEHTLNTLELAGFRIYSAEEYRDAKRLPTRFVVTRSTSGAAGRMGRRSSTSGATSTSSTRSSASSEWWRFRSGRPDVVS